MEPRLPLLGKPVLGKQDRPFTSWDTWLWPSGCHWLGAVGLWQMQSKGREPWCSQWLLPVSRYWYLLTSSLRPQRLSEASVWMYCTWGILLKPRYICGQKGTWSWERVPGPISMLLCSIWVSGSPAQPVSDRLLTYHHRVPCTPEKDIYSFPWARSMSHSATLPYSSTYFSLKLQYPFTYPKQLLWKVPCAPCQFQGDS